MINYPPKVTIEEQGLRDGFQSEKKLVPVEMKLSHIDSLIEAGLKRIQVTSFVHPKLMPQMADAEELCSKLKPRDGVLYTGLVLNIKGIERAANAGLAHVSASLSASDTHGRKNANASLEEARKRFVAMIKAGKDAGLKIRGGVQCAFGCRFEGNISQDVVLDLVKEQLDQDVDEIALADSTGMANPVSMQELSAKVMELAGDKPYFLHIHDTEGKGIVNAVAAMQVGASHFDTAFAGMGGCPFIKGASGNIATDDMVFMLKQMGIETGIDIDKIAAMSRGMETYFEKQFSGKMHRILGRDDIKYAL
ncbi:MAG: hydroxymethylglutaryl-CoA lyase [Proteobacteria bacterium]|nr:hydroxymethylglutaryl-CoA lyase [Pseudomonadota bacterium]